MGPSTCVLDLPPRFHPQIHQYLLHELISPVFAYPSFPQPVKSFQISSYSRKPTPTLGSFPKVCPLWSFPPLLTVSISSVFNLLNSAQLRSGYVGLMHYYMYCNYSCVAHPDYQTSSSEGTLLTHLHLSGVQLNAFLSESCTHC